MSAENKAPTSENVSPALIQVSSTELLGARYGAPKLKAANCNFCRVPLEAHLWSKDGDGDWWDAQCPRCGSIFQMVCVLSPETLNIMSHNVKLTQ